MSNSKLKKIIIFGSSETAALANYYFENDSKYKVIAFTVDDDFVDSEKFCGLPLLPFSNVLKNYSPSEYAMHVALSYSKLNQLRQKKYEQAKKAGYILVNYICSKSCFWPDLKIGDNCFILENQTIQPTVEIGNNVMIWSGNHIGHGTTIGDHTYISSHLVISGHCNIGQRCFLGVNATIKDFTDIGDDVFISMGANITSNIASGSVVLARKSDIYSSDDKVAKLIKKKTFGV